METCQVKQELNVAEVDMLLHGNPPPQNNNSSRFDDIFDDKRGSGASTNILSQTVLRETMKIMELQRMKNSKKQSNCEH